MTMHVRLFITQVIASNVEGGHPRLSIDKKDYKGLMVECSEEKAKKIMDFVERELQDDY